MSLDGLKIYRRARGGAWRKYESTGQLPGLFGSWWTRNKVMDVSRYHILTKVEMEPMRTRLLRKIRKRFDATFFDELNKWRVIDKRGGHALYLQDTHTALYYMARVLLSTKHINDWMVKVKGLHKSFQ